MIIWWSAIVGGVPAPAGEWPDAAAIIGVDGDLCTGTLIAPEWVLTAGHCVRMERVILGATDFEQSGESIPVVEQFIHADASVTFDLSLLRLARAPLGIEPRPIVDGCLTDFIRDGENVTVAGFGRLDRDAEEITSALHTVTVPILDADCADPDRGCHSLIGPGAEFIAGGKGLDSCAGDSGGPAYLEIDGQSWLVGVVSRSAIPYDTPCGDGGIYVRANAALPWIRQITGLPFPAPSCEGLNLPPLAVDQELRITQGARVALVPDILDANPTDQHTVEVLEGPLTGWMDGTTYRANPFQLGRDHVLLRITDDGVPALSSVVAFTIEVVPAGTNEPAPPGGCSTASGSWWGWWALLPFLYRRWDVRSSKSCARYRRFS